MKSLVSCLAALFMLAACAPAVPQTPVTPLPAVRSTLPTESPRVITIPPAPATPPSGVLDEQKIEQGQARYETLECSLCHGENGRGTNKGPALVGLTLGESDFMNVLRTGGNLGSAHVYPTSRLSDADGSSLYLYILSFNGGQQ